MKGSTITIDKLTPGHQLEVTVIVSRMFRLRLIVAIVLFKLASRILGCGVKVTHEINEGGDGKTLDLDSKS